MFARMSTEERSQEPHRRIASAIAYAMRKHAGQERKDGSPYIIHLLRVMESLRSIGGITDPDVVIAGVLHDAIEDTDAEHASLERRFGRRVADLVAVLTGDMRLPKVERRLEVIERARAGDADVKAVRLADRLDNLTDMKGFSEARKAEYVEEARRVLEACRGANAGLEQALLDAITRLDR